LRVADSASVRACCEELGWTLPVIGAIIIASPFPDEIGVSLVGISKIKTYQFLLVSFILNAIGIFLVVSASAVIKL